MRGAAIQKQEALLPNHQYFRYRNGVAYDAYCFAPQDEFSWSLANLYTQADVEREERLVDEVSRIALHLGIRRLYGPSVAFHSGDVVDARRLTDKLVLPGGVKLHRKRELPSCATTLEVGDAMIASAAGCMFGCVAAKSTVAAFHASTWNLLDKQLILTGNPGLAHKSVIDACIAFLRERGEENRWMTLRGFFYIRKEELTYPLDHPRYGSTNLKIYDHILDEFGVNIMDDRNGAMDLTALATARARPHRLREVGFAQPLRPDMATTRNQPEHGTRRDLILIHRIA